MARLLAILRGMSQDTGSDNATFFTVIGSQDPQVSPGEQQGPALDLLDALLSGGHQIDEVLLVWTPGATNRNWPGGYDDQKDRFVTAVRERLPQVKVKAVEMRARPNSAAEVLPVLAGALAQFRQGRRLHVNTSSGTPQMLEALKVLRGTGWFAGGGVTLWQIDRPEYRVAGEAHWREARTPFLEEALRLESAFGALERFDFAGAEDAFNELAQAPLELPGRNASVQALADIAHALWLLDARDFAKAADVMRHLAVPVPAVAPLEKALRSAEAGRDGVLWLTWARFDRAVQQDRVADALIWAVILREAMVINLLVRRGIADEAKELRRSADNKLWEDIMLNSPELQASVGNKTILNIKDISKKLMLLRTGVFVSGTTAFVDALDDQRHPDMEKTAFRRNKVIHQGAVPQTEWLESAEAAVSRMINEYPFQDELHCQWQKNPRTAPFSAKSLLNLVAELKDWVG